LIQDKGKLIVRDLGSSNGTFVNGKRVLGQQALRPGDVITVGGVTLKLEGGTDSAARVDKPATAAVPKPGDTAVVDAIAIEEDDLGLEEEFEIEIEEEPEHMDIIPLDDEPAPVTPVKPSKPVQAPAAASGEKPRKPEEKAEPSEPISKAPGTPEEEDAVAQFLMDLKLDDED
jgi:pSer/pThr/pTyr-binding forkhead associated (FHA) protein